MALTGTETLQVLGQNPSGVPAATTQQTTTGAIAALASTQSSPFVSTAISTVGNGTLTAAGLVGGQIVRTGPVAAYTDTTDTAANIVAALPGLVAGETFFARVKNATAFTQTIAAGIGVTLPTTVIVPAFSIVTYVVTINSATAVTFTHLSTEAVTVGTNITAPAIGALTTVGAGTITAALMIGGYTSRTGSTSAFTDTTDIAANIIAAQASIVNKIGTAFEYTYSNSTVAPATITGGIGVTVSGVTVVPANSWVKYLVTYTATATLTMVAVSQGYYPNVGSYVNNGATPVTVANTAVTAGSIISFTLKTVGGTVSASAPNVKTITPGTGFTVAGLASDSSTYNYEIRG